MKLDTVLPYNAAISILGIYTTDLATYKQLYKQLLTTVDDNLFIISQTGSNKVILQYVNDTVVLQ